MCPVAFNRPVIGGHPAPGPRTAYTPVIVGSSLVWNVNTAHYWREDDQHLSIQGHITFNSGVSAGGAVNINISLPVVDGVQLTINSSMLSAGGSTSNNDAQLIGEANWFQTGVAWKYLTPTFSTRSTFEFNDAVGKMQGNRMTGNDGIKYFITVPIWEWS